MNTFLDQFDDLFMMGEPVNPEAGEDNMFGAVGENCAAIGVFDGCHGLGSRKYPVFHQHTGAYMSSRCISGAVRDWFMDTCGSGLPAPEEMASGIRNYITEAFAACTAYVPQTGNLKGSLRRDFPATFTLALMEEGEKNFFDLHIFTAGDSRIYLLNPEGLAQLSVDDTCSNDALWSLRHDPPMTNVVSSDGRYDLNWRKFRLRLPFAVITATDGCFAYVPTPMDFEDMILEAMTTSKTPDLFEKNLQRRFSQTAQDDSCFGWMSAGFGSFQNMKKAMTGRYKTVKDSFIKTRPDLMNDKKNEEIWEIYRKGYERYLPEEIQTGRT
jgi:hypothetical protein